MTGVSRWQGWGVGLATVPLRPFWSPDLETAIIIEFDIVVKTVIDSQI